MAGKAFSEDQANNIIGQIRTASSTLDALRYVRQIGGFKHATYFMPMRKNHPMILPFLKTTISQEWRERYLLQRYSHIDPVYKSSVGKTKPIFWSEIEGLNDLEIDFFKDAAKYGVGQNGVSIPLYSTPNRFGLLSLTSDLDLDEWKITLFDNIKLLQKAAYEIHLKAVGEVYGRQNTPQTV